ncbi:hypothetical protein NDI54_18525 [Haloarcula sp. S1AR25-5A]|uniref:DUF7527 domain-containing protein n=1 Tax=Haloarcula terrestris TaxID=2950533 RepID=A0AAE4JI64_9EURY|nr:hypothetical protein [Haloarcula terrestris]MDS0223342.1 hypothetical protein [Haloarcula terrestris]
MSTRTVERVDGWESVPFDGGFAGLQKLAGQEFSGAVIAGPTRLFMLNGTVVGVLDGTIDDFEDASGTAKRSPHEALPLLAVMQERADEVKAQYYTEDTALEEVDQTLSSGNFTGFIELSENVLSGDYYTVYHQGRSMSVAWVGNSDKLLTDDEAFETANDEVGIYEVMPVDIEPIEIPEPPEDDTDEESGDAAAAADPLDAGDDLNAAAEPDDADAVDAGPTDEVEPDEPTPRDGAGSDEPVETPSGAVADTSTDGTDQTQPAAESTPDRSPASGGPPGSKAAGATSDRSRRGSEPSTDDQPEADETLDTDDTPDTRATTETDTETAPQSDRSAPDQQTTDRDTAAAAESRSPATEPSETKETQQASARSSPAQSEPPTATEGSAESTDANPSRSHEPQPAQSQSGTAAASTPESGSGESSAGLETRSIPSLDPNKSGGAQESPTTSVEPTQTPPTGGPQASTPRRDQPAQDDPTPSAGSDAQTTPSQENPTAAEQDSQPTSDQPSQPSTAGQSQPPADEATSSPEPERVAELESELEQRAEAVSALEADIADLEATNQELRDERDRLESELADARAEISRLEEQLDEQDDTSASGARLSASEAINGTNLFVRYDSKGKATLEDAKDSDASREEVEANLRLEYHTQFEAEGATVGGTPFQEFLEDSIQYRFVNWLIRNLLYEIRDTGHAGAMKDLYEGLPAIDRAELNGNVTVKYTEDGQENRSQERFDVVVRDRMGNPLVVANINDSREPASEGQMSDLIRNAERVGNASGSLASAFLVTSSFFEPGALETAEEATSSGLFNRDKRKSFVNLSRKEGFHLCLLEARNQEFHLAVPEL